jgi:thiol-disulfide isomerase/thioredoxin
MKIHPNVGVLSRYAADELPTPKRARVAFHLASCSRCREIIQARRAITDAIRTEPVPGLPADTFQRILARRSAGERVILPASAPGVRRHKPWFAVPAIAAAIVLLVIGALVGLRAPELEAEASELRILPEKPRAGEEIRVEYRATSKLAGEDSLVLRARFFFGESRFVDRRATVATLTRSGDRMYRGRFQLPDSVVYAAFAVENFGGDRVDYNPAEWTSMVHGADGQPLFAALASEADYRSEWDTGLALETARKITQLYPDSIEGWTRLYYGEKEEANQEGKDSLRAVHRMRLHALERQLVQRSEVTPEVMSSLYFYASAVEDTVVERRWMERLIRENPTHPAAVQLRVFKEVQAHRGDPPRLLILFERLWEEGGASTPQLPFTAFTTAQRAGDSDALRRWGERLEQAEPDAGAMIARAFSQVPSLRKEAMPRLRARIRYLDELQSEDRRLGHTIDDQRRDYQRGRGFFLGQLGRALIDAGHTEAGLDTLARAVEATWNVELFRTIAETKLAAGDTAGALPVFARAAADPATTPAFSDSARLRVGRHFDANRWAELTKRGRQELHTYIWSQATNRGLRGKVRLADLEGTTHTFQPESDRPTFVAFWSRYCPPSLMELDQLQQISDELHTRGVRTVAITDEEPSSDVREFLKKNNHSFPVFFDTQGDAQRAFDNRATPRYFVLEPSGQIRFDTRLPDDVIRQVALLQTVHAARGRSPESGERDR